MSSRYEEQLALAIKAHRLPEPVRQWRFAEPHREYRVDFAWPDHRLIVEVDGGAFMGRGGRGGLVSRTMPQGHHQTVEDYRKRNLINLLGFTLLCFQPAQIPLEAIEEIKLYLSGPLGEREEYLKDLWLHIDRLGVDDARRRRMREAKGKIRKAADARRRLIADAQEPFLGTGKAR